MNEIPFRTTDASQVTPLIELKNIWKTYVTGGDVRVDALKGVSMAIHPGEFVAIMGASGSGKSTLMNILGCLDRPSDGEYFFNGQDVSKLDADALAFLRREAFGFVFQSYNLLGTATAEENVEIPRSMPACRRTSDGNARASFSNRSGWVTGLRTVRASCPAASSSACRSLAR